MMEFILLLIKANDLPDAIEIAKNCPIFDYDGIVEVREVHQLLNKVGFQGKPISLWLIDAGYDLVGMVIGGIILAVWKRKPAPAPVA